MSDPWAAEKIPLGPGLIHRHGKIEADFTNPRNVPKIGPAGPKGDTGATGPPGPTSIELPPYTAADAGKSLVVTSAGTLAWVFVSGGAGGTGIYDGGITYDDSATTYEGT